MRLLSLLFAFYFACLSCMTCSDEVPACKDKTQTTVTATSHSDSATDALGDWCSPLCQCHCCGGAVVLTPTAQALTQVPHPVWDTTPRPGTLLVAAPTWASGAVWQPPQA
ncbi:DUF6660 family protein [Hymenobacter guriensis]|uniref:DUF6660 family protein n=1 Tax=Hymenobacter guriensis TaxID=2793065 RepID=UPI0037428A6E